jgi:hypothetical protein
MKRFNDYATTACAIAPLTSSAAMTGLAVNATGAKRARFVFVFGTGSADAKFDAKIWNAATSGATYTSMASAVLVQVSSGAGLNNCAIIDVLVDQDKPWLKMSGGVTSSNYPVAAIVDIYRPDRAPLTALTQQVVSVS